MLGKKYRYLFMALDKITNPIALAIIQEDLNALEAFYAQGWNINEPFYLNETYKEGIYPINLAFTGDVYEKTIRWLLENGIDFQSIRGRSPIIYAGF
ncbi:unnamed protein product [Commensalibacter communis]|uniref:hypothetical protein n=1 Tax=Commensalibacter communis TaxID=2972786 RepID=UPI0022FFAA26|nr:hypothetical protein [Commensalibacter communis]CAI3949979.1 unnamed protein product [Commensalibacter communis]